MKRRQLYWENVKVGQEIPCFSIAIDATRIALQVSGSQDFYRVHHDKEFAQAAGHRDVFVNTSFMQGCFNRLIWDWIGDEGWLRKFKMQMRRMNMPGDTITLKGKVTKKYVTNGDHYVECDLWAENKEGVTTPAQATVILPSMSRH